MPSYQPWQSWSGATPNPLPWPSWDTCPLPGAKTLPVPRHSTSVVANKAPKKTAPTHRLPQPQGYWCSWYAFGENIDEQTILEQSQLARQLQLPIDTIIIDDGWTTWGDWRQADPHKFPSGLKQLAKQIRRLKFEPGLWLAPFLASPRSQLLRDHPEFFVRQPHSDQLVNGFRSFPPLDYFFYRKYLLDFGQKAVQEYLFESLDQIINNWGIKVLKLDFLYAPYFNPHLQTAAQASRQVRHLLRWLRQHHPQVFIIACGCPFADAHELVDQIRISKDSTAPPPYPNWLRKILYRRSMRALARKTQQPWLWSGSYPDPDVQMWAFDDQQTRQILAKLDDSFVRGYGDDLRAVK